MKPLRLFISRALQDLPYAAELQARLAAAGHLPWMEEVGGGNLPPGLDHDAVIFRTIEQSDALLVLLSPYGLASPAVRAEWQYARRRNLPVLLLVVQSISPGKLLAALQPSLPGPTPPPDGEMLPWIDVRGMPLEAAWRVLAWLKDRSGACYDLPPPPVEASRFYQETLPGPARLAGWGQLILAAVSLPFALAALLALDITQIRPPTPLFLDQFLLALLTGACVFWLVQLARLAWNGVETFSRRCLPPGELLRPLAFLFLSITLLLSLLGFASSMLGKTALLHGALYPTKAYILSLFSAALTAVSYLLIWLTGRSRTLYAWLPRRAWAAARAPAQESAPSPRELPKSPAVGITPPANGNGATYVAGRSLGEQPQPIPASTLKARLYLPRRLRLAVSSGPVDQALEGGPSGLGLIQVTQSRPAHQVSVLFAPQDAPFGRSLEHYLIENGLRVQNDLQECVQAHVNARINVGATPSLEDGALILVLSPWAKEAAALRSYWQSAQAAGMPIVPVLLEDTSIPREFSQLRWVDARRDLPLARRQILEAVRGEQEPAPAPLPQPPLRHAQPFSSNGHHSPASMVLPQSVQWAQWGLYISSALKLLVLAVLFPMALWMAPPLSPSQWLSAGLLLAATYTQLLAIMLFFWRRLSYPWMMLIQVDCLLAGLVAVPFLSSDLFWPVSSMARVALLFPVWEAALFGWLAFAPEIRHWALGGFWVRLRQLRLTWENQLNLLLPLLVALVFLVPAFQTGPRPLLRVQPGALISGETILVRLLPDAQPQPWTFSASQGDLVTIEADGGFNTFLLQFFLARQNRFITQSESTLGSASITSFRLPADGVYEIHLADLPRSGLFRLSLSLQHPALQTLPCNADRQAQQAAGQPGGWIIQAQKGDTLHLRMDALDWTLDPWINLYGPTGSLVASDDDSGRTLNARLPAFYVSETGDYTLHTGGQPGTSGAFQLSIICSH